MIRRTRNEQQSFGGTCPACCGDLYLSAYRDGWALRCICCQVIFRENGPASAGSRLLMGLGQAGEKTRREAASLRGG